MKKEHWYVEGLRRGIIQEASLLPEDTRAIDVGLMHAVWDGDRWWRVTNELHAKVHEIYKMLVAPFRTRGKRAEVEAKLRKQSAEWKNRLGPRDNILPPEAVTRDGLAWQEKMSRQRENAVANSRKTNKGRSRKEPEEELDPSDPIG